MKSITLIMICILLLIGMVLADPEPQHNNRPMNGWTATPYTAESGYKVPGFSDYDSKLKVTESNSNNIGVLTFAGTSRFVEVKASLIFSAKNDEHRLTIINVTDESLAYAIDGEKDGLEAGVGKKYDFDKDGVYDAIVSFNTAFPPHGRFADLTLYLSEDAAQKMAQPEPKPMQKQTQKKVPVSPTRRSGLAVAVGLAAGVVIILAGILFLIRKKGKDAVAG